MGPYVEGVSKFAVNGDLEKALKLLATGSLITASTHFVNPPCPSENKLYRHTLSTHPINTSSNPLQLTLYHPHLSLPSPFPLTLILPHPSSTPSLSHAPPSVPLSLYSPPPPLRPFPSFHECFCVELPLIPLSRHCHPRNLPGDPPRSTPIYYPIYYPLTHPALTPSSPSKSPR